MTDTPENEHVHTAECGHDHSHAAESEAPSQNPECTREVSIDLPASEVGKVFGRVVANYKKYAKIPGFRAGKATDSVIKSRYAKEIRKDVMDELLVAQFNAAVQKEGVRPVGQPMVLEFQLEDGQPMHVKLRFEYMPVISVDGYQDVKVEKPSVEVTEDDVKLELESMRNSRASLEPVEEDRAIVDGDVAQISYTGKVEGDEATDPITGDDAMVEVGSDNTIDAFNQILRGAKVGQELKAEVTYPEEYGEPRLSGKKAIYEVTVKAVKKRVLPELNDEFAKEMNADSLEALTSQVRERITGRKERTVRFDTKEKLNKALAEKFTFPVPEALVGEQVEARLERGLRALSMQGMSPEAMRGLDFAQLRKAQREGALQDVKTMMILDKISEVEKVEVTEEEMERELQMYSLQSQEPLEQLKARMEQEGSIERLRLQIRHEKTGNLLFDRL